MTSPTPWSLAYEAEGTTEAAWVLRDPDRDIIEVADNVDAAKRWATAHLAAIGLSVETWEPHHPGPGTQPSHWNAVTADEFATADAWADALDAEMKRTGRSVGDLISHGYADGQLLGVPLSPEHENADDEGGVVVGDAPDGSTWTVRYNQQTGWWEAAW
jgi:hypothetical protein